MVVLVPALRAFISTMERIIMTETQPEPPVVKEFGGYTDVARALTVAYPNPQEKGLKAFTRQQVHVWWLRRERNGFPGKYPRVVNGSKRELFRVSEVVSWYEGYIPNAGGRTAASGSQETVNRYVRQHRAVYAARGKAADQKCVDCGKQAYEWSTIHGTDGSDPHAHYEPRCKSCHNVYDEIHLNLVGKTSE